MFVIYIKDHNGNLKTQIFEINSLEVKQKLNDSSRASFEVANISSSNSYDNFKEFNEVSIYKIENNKEKLIFDGIIRGIEADLNTTKVILNDKIFLLKNKILYTDKIYTNIQIKTILADILGTINTRYDTKITLNSDILDQVTKTYKKGQTFFDILKDLSLNGYEFKLENNILYFLNSIGEDRITGSNFVEFSYDIHFPGSRTIDTAKLEYDSENITNALISKETGNDEDLPSINEFGRIEKYFISGDKTTLLLERIESVRELEISPVTYDFFVANLGDTVKVFIDAGNDIMRFDGGLKIIEKEFRSGELNKIKIKLSKGNIKTLNFVETIADLKDRTKNLEI